MKCATTRSLLSMFAITSGLAMAEPDLIVSEITSATTFGTVDGKMAYSFGTTVCNIGDSELAWIDNTNEHPIVSQTIYKLADGQFEQLGIGFVRHTSIPLSSNACGLGCTPAGFDALGAGCSDTSSSVVHGAQPSMGPRTEVNAFTGDYPYPFTSIGQTGDLIYKRLRVNLADISDPSALYFVETQVISSSETTDQARANNVSYRQVVFSPGSASASVVGPTYTEQPAIFAWRDHGNGIGMPDASVMITQANIPGSGERFVIGSKATSIGIEQWRYDYAIYNMNGQRSIRELAIGFSADPKAVFGSIEFQAPSYHDDVDSQILNTPWMNTTENSVRWFTETFAQNEFSNAIRWGTMYHFGFEVNTVVGPSVEGVLVGFFGVDEPDAAEYLFNAIAPPHNDFICEGDINGDGEANFFDVSAFLGFFAAQDLTVDVNGDGELNFFDVSAFLSLLAIGCP